MPNMFDLVMYRTEKSDMSDKNPICAMKFKHGLDALNRKGISKEEHDSMMFDALGWFLQVISAATGVEYASVVKDFKEFFIHPSCRVVVMEFSDHKIVVELTPESARH